MHVERRGFLSLLGMGALAHAIDLPKFLVYEPAMLKVASANPLVPLDRLALAIMEELNRALPREAVCMGGYGFGDPIPGRGAAKGWFATQRYVDFMIPVGEEHEVRQRYVEPVAESLAWSLKDVGATVFAVPSVPVASDGCVVTSPRSALSLSVVYDMPTDDTFLRCAVIGGRAS